jgi:hypothetical protein
MSVLSSTVKMLTLMPPSPARRQQPSAQHETMKLRPFLTADADTK